MQYAALRLHFGISATQADHVLPAWEVDALLRTVLPGGEDEKAAASPDAPPVGAVAPSPFDSVPDLKDVPHGP